MMKPITRLDTSDEEWNNSDVKKRFDAALKSKQDHLAYLAKYNSPEEVAKREAEQKLILQKLEASKRRNREIAAKYEKLEKENGIINNKKYYFMIENQIRKLFPLYEVRNLLPLAEDVLKTSSITFNKLKDYPIEGYYYKNDNLKKYFKIIRNLQENHDLGELVDQSQDCFKILKSTTDLELFGKVKSDKTHGRSILPRRYDIVALSAKDEDAFDLYSLRPWTLQKIVDNLSKHFSNTPNLVELAYLTKDIECLICGAETNALYRDVIRTKGMSYEPKEKWQVDKEVERMGKAIIEEYNKRFKLSVKTPTEQNHKQLSMIPERPRVAAIGEIIQTGENYFWKSDLEGNVTDIYTKEFLTTETEKKRLKINQEYEEEN